MNFKTIQNNYLKGLHYKYPLVVSSSHLLKHSKKLKPIQKFNHQLIRKSEFRIGCEKPDSKEPVLIGEDAALFKLKDQKLLSWSIFTILLSSVLALMYLVIKLYWDLI